MSTLKSPPPQAFSVSDVHPRLRKCPPGCTLDCGFKTSESPALRGIEAERCPIRGTSLYLVLKSNGLRHSKNLPVKFVFSLKTVPANIAKKLPPQRCFKPLLIPIFNFPHKRPTLAFTGKVGTHSPFGKRSHTRAHTAKQGHSLPRPQCGFALPVNSFLFRHAFIYIHFPVHCEPPLSAERKIRRNCRHKFYRQPFLIPVFNFSHKRPTFAFTPESGYTLGSAQRIAHNGSHGETGGVLGGGGITILGAFHTVRKPCVAGYQNGVLCRFWVLVWCAPEERREPAGQRCTYVRRCPEASRPHWAA